MQFMAWFPVLCLHKKGTVCIFNGIYNKYIHKFAIFRWIVETSYLVKIFYRFIAGKYVGFQNRCSILPIIKETYNLLLDSSSAAFKLRMFKGPCYNFLLGFSLPTLKNSVRQRLYGFWKFCIIQITELH